jgi:hypothetical protein
MRAALESLLRARKLDITLLSSGPSGEPLAPDRVAPTGVASLDASLGGGLRRGQLSDIAGASSTGRTWLTTQMLAAATARGEAVALVDASDTFDPASAAAHGVALPHLLWVRLESPDPGRAVKAFSLVLQAGGFGLVVLDVADVAPADLRRLPPTTWLRLARSVEGGDTAALIVGADRIARSAGGVTIACEPAAASWQGDAPRARLFTGLSIMPRVVGPAAARARSSAGSGEASPKPLCGEGGSRQ